MRNNISRRGFLSQTAACGVTAASAITEGSGARAYEIEFPKKFEPQKICFMDQYYDGIEKIVKGIRETQIDTIAGAIEKAYELKRKGGKIYSHVIVGHYCMFAGSPDRPGQPMVLPQSSVRALREDIGKMKKGDFLLTNHVSKESRELRERGVYVVGITNN